MRMPFDLEKLPRNLTPWAGVNGALYERLYRRHKSKWYSPFCRHGAFKVFAEDPFPIDPSGEEGSVLQTWTLKECDEQLLLVTSKCLVCGKVLLEGRLRKPDGSENAGGCSIRSRQRQIHARSKGHPRRSTAGVLRPGVGIPHDATGRFQQADDCRSGRGSSFLRQIPIGFLLLHSYLFHHDCSLCCCLCRTKTDQQTVLPRCWEEPHSNLQIILRQCVEILAGHFWRGNHCGAMLDDQGGTHDKVGR